MNVQPVPHPGSSIDDKITWAEETYATAGDRLIEEKEIGSELESLVVFTKEIAELMQETGLVDLCRHCEEDEGGSCCGRGIENRYDAVLLLINVMLGVALQKARMNKSSCRFLSSTGCTLLARTVICISYVCDTITLNIPTERLSGLREKEGELLKTLYRLDILIRKKLTEIRDAQ